MKDRKEYRDAPNPTPKPVVQRLWALTDQKGRFHRYYDGQVLLHKRKPSGGFQAGVGGWVVKPRRVRVTVEAL